MTKGAIWIIIALLLSLTAAATLFIVLRIKQADQPDYVLKRTKKQKEVNAKKLQTRLDHSGKEELMRSVIKLMKQKDHAALWYAIMPEERQFLLKKHEKDQEKIEKLFLELLQKTAGSDEEKFLFDMLRDRIHGIRLININDQWYIVPVELSGHKPLEI